MSRVSAGRPGAIVDAPSAPGGAELLSFDASFTAKLLGLAPEESLRADDWPVAPGVRRSVVLTRRDVYAPDARIVRIDGDREIELPRSRLLFFRGESGDGTRVGVSLDPDSGQMRGLSIGPEGLHELVPPEGSRRQQMIVAQGGDRDPRAPAPSWKCSEEEMTIAPGMPEPAPAPSSTRSALLAYNKSGVIAVDTDNEFMNLKFANNTTNASNYIASLFNYMNIIYERDLQLILLEGYTILRVSTTTDPWTQNSNGNASVAELNEISSYWSTHYGNVKRMDTAMLSGKQPNPYSASGIAWTSGSPNSTVLCGTANSYTFSKVFMFQQDTSSWDVLITAHETGHNFGSPHTHCYADPKPDTCYNGEACYRGGTSCPAPIVINGYTATGTLMSYCHLSPCNSSSTLALHPQTLSRYMNGNVALAFTYPSGPCIFTVGATLNPAPTVTNINPPTGALGGGTSVTVTGTNFVSGATVAFADLTGSYGLTSVNFVSSTTLTATTPAHAAGVVDVAVFNPDQQTGALKNGFTYTTGPPAPTVTGISPNNGSTLGGTPVTITGTGFVNGATVKIGGVAATSVAFVNSTTLTATTGAHATGTVDVTVTNPDLTSGTKTGAFFYLPSPTSTRLHPLTPCRVLDTRNTNGPLGGPALQPNATRLFILTGTCAIPSGAVSVSVNMTVVPTASGLITVYPGNGLNAGTNNLSFNSSRVRANNALLFLATDGTGSVSVTNSSAGANHFILDVNGYFQ